MCLAVFNGQKGKEDEDIGISPYTSAFSNPCFGSNSISRLELDGCVRSSHGTGILVKSLTSGHVSNTKLLLR